MKKYLKTLLEEINQKSYDVYREVREDEVIPEELETYLKYDENDYKNNIGKTIGLIKEQFPPETYWSTDELTQINKAFRDMLARFNLDADMPRNLPPHLEYRTLVSVLDKNVPLMPFGTWHMEFCDYVPEQCPFGSEYCTCIELQTKWAEEEDSKNIPFIHNYCDRWCERCPFTNRCAVYAHTKALDLEAQDINNKAFWDNIAKNLKDSFEKLTSEAENFGIEFEEPTEEELAEFAKEQDELLEKVKSTKLYRWCRTYSMKTHEWYKEKEPYLKKAAAQYKKNTEGVGEIDEYTDILTWYMFFIEVKFERALSGKFDDLYEYEQENFGYQTDSNGSAKVALISAERSFEALSKLMDLIPSFKDSIFPLIALLHRIINEGKKEFPDTNKFIRPGFDDAF